ncbi:MAG TPA: WD40 repeat domain-containing protein, partial [Thermopolyspora sp.]
PRRRFLIGGIAASAASAVSTIAILRLGDGERRVPTGTTTTPTGRPTSSPAASPAATAGSTATSPNTSPTTSAPSTPAAETLPFGTQVTDPVSLPARAGTTVDLAADQSIVVCGLTKGMVLVWDAGTATPVRRLVGGGSPVTSVAIGNVDGRQVVASGHTNGTMRLLTTTGEQIATHRAGDPVIAVSLAGGTPVAISQKYDGLTDLTGLVRFWNLATGKQIGASDSSHFQGISGLTFGRYGDEDVAVTGDGNNRVRVWRLRTGKVLRTFHTEAIGGIERLAYGEVRGRQVIVSTHLDATLRVYDPHTGERLKKWEFSNDSPDDRGVTALSVGILDDVPIAVVVHTPTPDDCTLRLWNLTNGEIIDERPIDRAASIHALTLTTLAGRPVAILAGADRKLRAWSLGTA